MNPDINPAAIMAALAAVPIRPPRPLRETAARHASRLERLANQIHGQAEEEGRRLRAREIDHLRALQAGATALRMIAAPRSRRPDPMTLHELAALAQQTRNAQRRYFQARRQLSAPGAAIHLETARALEKNLDKALEAILAPPGLFPDDPNDFNDFNDFNNFNQPPPDADGNDLPGQGKLF
jgi:hypothetical protein